MVHVFLFSYRCREKIIIKSNRNEQLEYQFSNLQSICGIIGYITLVLCEKHVLKRWHKRRVHSISLWGGAKVVFLRFGKKLNFQNAQIRATCCSDRQKRGD